MESNRPVLGFYGYPLVHHVKHFKMARKQGRIFINPDLSTLPEGSYTYILNDDNEWVFGLDVDGYEIGIKHFVLARGRGVQVAGEWTRGRYNLESGTYSREHERIDPEYHPRMRPFVGEAFRKMGDPDVVFSNEKILIKVDQEHAKDLSHYCADDFFRKKHKYTICRDYCETKLED